MFTHPGDRISVAGPSRWRQDRGREARWCECVAPIARRASDGRWRHGVDRRRARARLRGRVRPATDGRVESREPRWRVARPGERRRRRRDLPRPESRRAGRLGDDCNRRRGRSAHGVRVLRRTARRGRHDVALHVSPVRRRHGGHGGVRLVLDAVPRGLPGPGRSHADRPGGRRRARATTSPGTAGRSDARRARACARARLVADRRRRRHAATSHRCRPRRVPRGSRRRMAAVARTRQRRSAADGVDRRRRSASWAGSTSTSIGSGSSPAR